MPCFPRGLQCLGDMGGDMPVAGDSEDRHPIAGGAVQGRSAGQLGGKPGQWDAEAPCLRTLLGEAAHTRAGL